MSPSWSNAIPHKQGLYDPDYEKDSCGVGFITHIKGLASHSIIEKGQSILCNMTHRGAVGADARDGDGAGVMTCIPHSFFLKLLPQFKLVPGSYAVGNVYMNADPAIFRDCQVKFVEIAHQLGLSIIHWRTVPVNPGILGPVALAKQPIIVQPFITWAGSNDSMESFDDIW
jgi:glutamate synthase (NADPH/NADH)